MKTAMQELFSRLEIDQPQLFNTNTLEGRKFINDYYKFFEMEKNQIYNAFSKGMQEQTQRQLFKNPYKTTPEEYYNETFKNK